jgi:UDP-glucose 4-epimerase
MNLEGRHVLVTGGAGFIGSHYTRELLDRGATVDVVDNYFAGEPALVPEGADAHELDIRSDAFGEFVRDLDPDVIAHLAAIHYIPYCNENPEEAFEVNVVGTRNLLEAARDCTDLDRVVFASSAAVYPPRDAANAESSELGPMDIYGRSKLVGEDLLRLFHEDTGVPASAARLFNVYGPDETNMHLIPAILDQIRDGSRAVELGNLSPARDFVYVEDVADALAELAAADRDGVRAYNVGTGEEHTVRDVAERVGDALGDDIDVEQAQDRVRESDRPHLRADVSRIERELGWTPQTSFVEGLGTLLEAEGIRMESEGVSS